MITYDTAATKYTGKLQGDYTGELPPATSEYTRLINAILNEEEMPLPRSDLTAAVYAFYGGDATLKPPDSRLVRLIQFGVYSTRYTIESRTEFSITVYDSDTGHTEEIPLDDDLEKIWAKIVEEGNMPLPEGYLYFLTSENDALYTSGNVPFLVRSE